MKTITTISLAGALAFALPIQAQQADAQTQTNSDAPLSTAQLLEGVAGQINDNPSEAGNVVRQAITQSKADTVLVLQIVKAAVLAAPEQAEAISTVAVALAPDAESEIQELIASLLLSYQVAETEFTGSDEPEGLNPQQNTVFDSNFANFRQGANGSDESGVTQVLTSTGGNFSFTMNNSLISRVQNTNNSPNANHNQGANANGGTTVVINPPATTPITP